jgi:hypothetical protein
MGLAGVNSRQVYLADIKRKEGLEQNNPGKADPEKNEAENNQFKCRHHDSSLDLLHVIFHFSRTLFILNYYL